MKFKKVGVLMGGLSAERDVSLVGGKAVAEGLREAGYNTVEIDVDRRVDVTLRESEIDAAFILLHGRHGEDGTIQGLLEMMHIPYTGSSVLSSALAMDKIRAREIFSAANLPMATGAVIEKNDPITLPDSLTWSVVVKPASEGSSVGVGIAKNEAEFDAAVKIARGNNDRVLVEQFIPGKEVNVAVINDKVIGAVEIVHEKEFYDYSSKYDEGGSTHYIPPRIPMNIRMMVDQHALQAYRSLGCTGAARVDFIVPGNINSRCPPSYDPMLLEVNTIPGMTPTSLLPEIVAASGISFIDLITQIIESARLHVD